MITSFPTDPQRRNQWLLNMGRPDDIPSNSARICSDHFLEKCFIRISENSNVRLKKDAVPTRFNSEKLQEITVAQTSSSTDPSPMDLSFGNRPAKRKFQEMSTSHIPASTNSSPQKNICHDHDYWLKLTKKNKERSQCSK